MKLSSHVFDKTWKINFLLIVCSFSIYFFYFHYVFLNINSILSGITGDALKNYYTFSYHIKNDNDAFHFSGMNFPFGENIVFTDCQPIITLLLRLLPFTHDYLIGILHALIFISYIVTPVILYRILRILDVDLLSSFFVSLAITLLSPQFARINGGHHALAYGCLIPLIILLLINFIQQRKKSLILKIMFFNFLLFFLHPYVGFSLSLFSFLTLLFIDLFNFRRKKGLTGIYNAFVGGLLPIVEFKIFMNFSDLHSGRTTQPHGSKILIENLDSIMAPDFGPFQNLLEKIFQNKPTHIEGHSYVGFFTILLTITFIFIAPFVFKKFTIRKDILALFCASSFLLLISFGWHNKFFSYFNLDDSALSQFRASCRFAWFFYYMLPLLIFPLLYHVVKSYFNLKKFRLIFASISIMFFLSNLVEANSFFTKDRQNFWKFRNILNEKFLNSEEKEIVKRIRLSGYQAIIPLPLFVIGSEMYNRVGSDNSMIPAMLYSYHTKVPILSTWLSRTSIIETENMVELLNSYKKEKETNTYLNAKDFLVIKTTDALLPDEERLSTKVKIFHENDSLQYGEVSKKDLLERKIDKKVFTLNSASSLDSNMIIYIPTEKRKPFITSNMMDYETLYVLDSNKIRSGNYIVSVHYHYTKKIYKSVSVSLIITKGNGTDYFWQYNQGASTLSGFYPGFGVLEFKVELLRNSRYEFIFKGFENMNYFISDFLVRPEFTTVKCVKNDRDTLFNNFPN